MHNRGYSLLFALILCTLTSLAALQLYQHYLFTSITTQSLYHYHSLLSHAEDAVKQAEAELQKVALDFLMKEPGNGCFSKPCIYKFQADNNFLSKPLAWWEGAGSISKAQFADEVRGFYSIEKMYQHCDNGFCELFFRITVLVVDRQRMEVRNVQVVVSKGIYREGTSTVDISGWQRDSWVEN